MPCKRGPLDRFRSLSRRSLVGAAFAVATIATRCGFFITTPLWLDHFAHSSYSNDTPADNATDRPRYVPLVPLYNPLNTVTPFFVVICQWGFPAVFFGLVTLLLVLFRPDYVPPEDRNHPKRKIVQSGVAQGISSILINFAVSGTRVPPYLQAILANFVVPVQFLVRFLILRKRPTARKLLCAGVVLLAELACLVPVVFPSLESSAQHKAEGGSSGAARYLWPISMIASQVPFAVANSLMESNVQHSAGPIRRQLNLFYYLTCWCSATFLTCMAFFWVDLLPGFGTSGTVDELWQKMTFNFACLFASDNCWPGGTLIGWLNILACGAGILAFTGSIRYTEGANYVIVLLNTRTPLIFLFWTLFLESPFRWDPHVALSTWLSLGSVLVMVPAIVLYNSGAPEIDMSKPEAADRKSLVEEERECDRTVVFDDDFLDHNGRFLGEEE